MEKNKWKKKLKNEGVGYMVAVLEYGWYEPKDGEPMYQLMEVYNSLDHRGHVWSKEETIKNIEILKWCYPKAEEIRITPLRD